MDNELTTAQATDLARYFLGPDWRAGWDGTPSDPEPCFLTNRAQTFVGSSWRDVFRAAGVKLPSRSRFTAHGTSVMHEEETVATARSSNFAQRIAAALNNHRPNRRGI